VLEGRVSRASAPWWVKVSRWGVPGRGGLWACVAVALLAAASAFLYGLRDPRFLGVGLAAVLTAVPYWLTIRWVDKHGTWDDDPA
jgi:hypothetical protein